MKIKKQKRTIEIKFGNRKESIAFFKAMEMNKSAAALEEAEARENSRQLELPVDLLYSSGAE